MISPIQSLPAFRSVAIPLAEVAEVIVQLAIRVLFIATSILMAAAAFPVGFHAVVLPVVAFGSTFLAAFFFSQSKRVPASSHLDFPPLIRPVEGAPRGLKRTGLNCAFNALVHFLESDPQLAAWLRHSVSADSILHHSLKRFLHAYDEALRDNLPVIKADSQTLHVSFSRFTKGAISASDRVQQDPAELMAHLLEKSLPDDQKITTQTPDHPDPIKEKKLFLTLSFNGEPKTTLDKMYREYMDNNSHLICFSEWPPVLRFQIQRFINEPILPSLKTKLLSPLFPPPPPQHRRIKKSLPVEFPSEYKIVWGSERKTYRLVSFVHHRGSDPTNGHYTAGRIVNGQKYLIDDERVIPADQEEWNERLQEAYLVCYLPV